MRVNLIRSCLSLSLIVISCGLGAWTAAIAADGDSDDIPGVRDYDDIFSSSTSNTLLMRAKQSMRAKNYSKAIKYLEAAQKLNDEDPDVLTLYAEALDEKLAHQADKDPEVFKKCITAYLRVMRNEVGEEAGMNFKGIGIMNTLYNDEERGRFAKKRLKALTGYLPKPWETNDKYLERILRPATTTVTATIKPKEDAKENAKDEAKSEAPKPLTKP